MLGKVYWGVFAIAYPLWAWHLYEHFSDSATEEVAGSKKYHHPCGIPFKCDGIEIPQRVHWFSDVFAPTATAAAFTLALVIIIYKMLSMSADPADNDARK